MALLEREAELGTAQPQVNRQSQLPKLLYIGDVPVESSYHGSLLLYRLLEDYPSDKLCIVEGNLYPSTPQRRLKSVRYESLFLGIGRLLRTRFHKLYSAILTRCAPNRVRRVQKILRGFLPEAVLTVSHGYSWITAARFAAKHQLPLHLICHDDWPRVADLPAHAKSRLDRVFGSVYRQANSRLCVSSFMRDAYRQRYEVDADVLLPFRAADCPTYEEPPQRLRKRSSGLTVAFAGTINSAGYARALQLLTEILHKMGGRLLIFGPFNADDARRECLDRPNVELCGFVKSNELIERLRLGVDVLFLPMSFDKADRPNMELSFPSKLTDYTAVGLPLLIYGPDYSSAVRWALENPGVAEIVTRHEPEAQAAALERLCVPSHRVALAETALRKGNQFFSHRTAKCVFVANVTHIKTN
jgi:glycosyltransferase involved in cell wall biosynthesis